MVVREVPGAHQDRNKVAGEVEHGENGAAIAAVLGVDFLVFYHNFRVGIRHNLHLLDVGGGLVV